MNRMHGWLALGALGLLLIAGCQRENGFRSILPRDAQLRAGDVVFRRGGGFTSRAVLMADVNGNYSHVGIVVDSAGVMMVVHAVPDEPDYEGDTDRVKMDTPERFFSTQFTSVGEICRPRDAAIGRKAAETAMRLYKKGVYFDHDYDDADSTRMYCTELVAYAYEHAGCPLTGARRHEVSLPFFTARCIFPSDVHASPMLESILTFNK